jgi:hypothetical protein
MKRLAMILTLGVLTVLCLSPAGAQAAFGLKNFDLSFVEADGGAATQAGSHPYAVTNFIQFNSVPDPKLTEVPEGMVKNLNVELPLGLVGRPNAVQRCTSADFIPDPLTKKPACSDNSAVGTIVVKTTNPTEGFAYFGAAVYDLIPPPGVVQKLGFSVSGVPVTIEFVLTEHAPYRVVARLHYVSQALPILGSKLTIWGVPTDPSHDKERGSCIKPVAHGGPYELELTGETCPSTEAPAPFITLPRACQGPLSTGYEAESWEQTPGQPVTGSVLTHNSSEPPEDTGIEGCDKLGFAPAVDAQPTTTAAESPSGLDFDLSLSGKGLESLGEDADSDLEKAVVTLPAGVTTNPSVASGLTGCSFAQYEAATPTPGTGCPESSKVGSVEITTPLVEPAVDGSLYVAKQGDSPFHNLLTVYMVAQNPELGVVIRAAGRVEPNPQTGQLTTTFDELPQLPFTAFHLHFREGSRAPLISPRLCGSYETKALLYAYADPGVPVSRSATFSVGSGAGGSSCASAESALPNQSSLSAGTTNRKAGTYSPFVLNLARADGSQQISQISSTLPEGLLAKLAGIPYCPEAGIAQAASRSGEFQGAVELAQPSCPASSEVGTVTVGAGAGPQPYYVTGKAYLGGPYKGAPLSLEIITPAIAGPFDLGVVAVRTALNVDPLTAQVTAVSDPIPTILHGLPLDVRSIAVDLSRRNFILNPTSCEPKEIQASAISILGQTNAMSQYFQVGECGQLKFKPTLKLSLSGSTKHAGHPGLKAVLTYPKGAGYSNIARAQVNLPHSEFIDQANLNKTCTKPVLLEGKCPPKTVYGKAKAWSPLLEKPLKGKVYLVGGFGYKLPALVAELGGQIRVLLVGKVDSGPNHGIRNTFEAVPDAPVEKFELSLKGGKKYSLLENSEGLCARPQKASAAFVAQNGTSLRQQVSITNDCKRPKHKKAHKRHKKAPVRHGNAKRSRR